MGSILILQETDVKRISGLTEVLEEIKSVSEVSVSTTDHMPAVFGEFAGTALEILVSPYTQAIINAAALGALLYKALGIIKKAGKKVLISKEIVAPLVLDKTKAEMGKDFETKSNSIRIWGPMNAELIDGPAMNCIDDHQEALGPTGFFMAVAVTRPRNKVKTTYFLFGASGKLCGSWSSQTYLERVPEFLRPEVD